MNTRSFWMLGATASLGLALTAPVHAAADFSNAGVLVARSERVDDGRMEGRDPRQDTRRDAGRDEPRGYGYGYERRQQSREDRNERDRVDRDERPRDRR